MDSNSVRRPIFVATHPRACSTAFERVFMTRSDALTCVHEPFGDAFYYGPERMSARYENDEAARAKSGYSEVKYGDVMGRILKEMFENDKTRVFIKDMAYYIVPPNGDRPSGPARSLDRHPSLAGDNNPTLIPTSLITLFHWTFLIRHPRKAIPSYYRCTIPPLSKKTGFDEFMPSEAGYVELRGLFEFLHDKGIIVDNETEDEEARKEKDDTYRMIKRVSIDAWEDNKEAALSKQLEDTAGPVNITVIDADDLLDDPEGTLRAYCEAIGLDFDPKMLKWDDEESQKMAKETFEKWSGFHDDAIGSTELKPREHKAKTPTKEEENKEWKEKYGEEGQKIIRETVDKNVADYEYLKRFALKPKKPE
ncbi:P-loop containing nucleoside triphosphate hydrolase protein [Copromyces sp. CBS 386.78]|uniref:P-loop containing nucleoside triphosphate hydrolase protein n=1 Tax=Pseudoneurospora amorphoporcata TaxID=241081 RepID=A0AAN6SEX2_9PEZI|nr:P-loop containing nucleoside triphosphate hydrolase protein [Copromyces sp. CBS 386.78]KAK3950643.1 P-loop containing nucleoside triphosphate hydrolase protein [Pseudoneurospora amorphoporcata]